MSVEVNITRKNFRSKGHTCSERRREVLNAWKDLRGKLITNVFRQWISTRNLGKSRIFEHQLFKANFQSVPFLFCSKFENHAVYLFSCIC